MPRQISERTLKVREIVKRIPPERMTETTPTDVQAELEEADVVPRNDQDRQTLYAEFSRRRRKLGLLKTQRKKQSADTVANTQVRIVAVATPKKLKRGN